MHHNEMVEVKALDTFKPFVSVIMPAYNVAGYIQKSICSVLNQTLQDFELIIVDDKSDDQTVSVIQKYSDHRIRLIRNSVNGGPSYARNRAIDAARGKWIAFIDSDDWWAPERLECLLAIAEKENADGVLDDLAIVDRNGNSKTTVLTKRKIHLRQSVKVSILDFVEWDLGILKPFMRRDFLTVNHLRFDENFRSGEEDFPFMFHCLMKGAEFILIPEPLYFYRLNSNSLTSKRLRIFNRIKIATRNLLEIPNVRRYPGLEKTLKNRIDYCESVIAYNKLKGCIRSKELVKFLKQIGQKPAVIPFAIRRVSGFLMKNFII